MQQGPPAGVPCPAAVTIITFQSVIAPSRGRPRDLQDGFLGGCLVAKPRSGTTLPATRKGAVPLLRGRGETSYSADVCRKCLCLGLHRGV